MNSKGSSRALAGVWGGQQDRQAEYFGRRHEEENGEEAGSHTFWDGIQESSQAQNGTEYKTHGCVFQRVEMTWASRQICDRKGKVDKSKRFWSWKSKKQVSNRKGVWAVLTKEEKMSCFCWWWSGLVWFGYNLFFVLIFQPKFPLPPLFLIPPSNISSTPTP